MIPKILEDITKAVSDKKIKIAEGIEGEDRVASLKDEGTVIDFLLTTNLSEYILKDKARKFGDMTVLDYDGQTKYVVNIKTSIGSSDNATSKIGFLYAFTDMEPMIGAQYFAMVFVHCCLCLAFFHSGDLAAI